MKKTALFLCLGLLFLFPVTAQVSPLSGASRPPGAKDNLAILPFTGGQGNDGETIAELFSNTRIRDIFNLIPRTGIAQAVSGEQRFQMGSGMTDPDTIASIGRQLEARYVVAGNITALGNRKLLIISIMNIDNLQQIAGDYRTYVNIEDIRAALPRMAENIIEAAQGGISSRPRLAVVPVQFQDGADQRTADVLAQILSIHLIRSGAYAVYPRTSGLEQVQAEYRTQLSGITADELAVSMGRGENPRLVLSVAARSLGRINMFNASIIDIETGLRVSGSSAEYRNISEGLGAMETLAWNLTATPDEIRGRAQFSSLGITAGSSFTAPWLIAGLGGSFSPLPHTFVDAGIDFGFIHGNRNLRGMNYISLYPFAHINGYMPLGNFMGLDAGLYLGAGGGYLIALYWNDENDIKPSFPVFDIAAGIYWGKKTHYLRLGYSLRTTFEAVNHKIVVGYSYRFE